MNSSRGRKSFWPFAFPKFHFTRDSRRPTAKDSSDEFHSLGSETLVDSIEEQKDGFYRYSESLLEEEARLMAAHRSKSQTASLLEEEAKFLATYRSRSQTDDSSENFVMAPSRRHTRPYTVGSDVWVIPSTSSTLSQVLCLDDLSEVQLSVHFGNVLSILTRLYAIGKVLHVVFLSYGVELDASMSGMMYWLMRAEAEIRTESLATLIEIVENLYYALYARIVLEMANVELCSCFNVGMRAVTSYPVMVLPDANHLYRIFLICKDALDSPGICQDLQEDLVLQLQEEYIDRFIWSESQKDFTVDDLLGYRRYALSIVSDRTSAYCDKWEGLTSYFRHTPPEIITLLSEKYLAVVAKRKAVDDIPYNDLPFFNLKAVDPEAWERDVIQDHRIATLAKLEGRTVGEERREDPKIRLLSAVKQQKCICTAVCSCAYDCTYDIEHHCPCAERQLRIMLLRRRKVTDRYNFVNVANSIARIGFEGLAAIRHDVEDEEMVIELGHLFELFDLAIHKERLAAATASHYF